MRRSDARAASERLYAQYNNGGNLQPRRLDTFLRPLALLDGATLYRARSSVLNAGMGLFTGQALLRNQPITNVSGARVSRGEIEQLRIDDPDVKDYQTSLSVFDLFVLGNYVRDDDGRLRKVQSADMGTVFRGQGAAQFAQKGVNGPNAALVTVSDHRWNINPQLVDVIDATKTLKTRFPHGEGRASVLFALRDIGADEELIISYSEAVEKEMRKREVQSRRDRELARLQEQRAHAARLLGTAVGFKEANEIYFEYFGVHRAESEFQSLENGAKVIVPFSESKWALMDLETRTASSA